MQKNRPPGKRKVESIDDGGLLKTDVPTVIRQKLFPNKGKSMDDLYRDVLVEVPHLPRVKFVTTLHQMDKDRQVVSKPCKNATSDETGIWTVMFFSPKT